MQEFISLQSSVWVTAEAAQRHLRHTLRWLSDIREAPSPAVPAPRVRLRGKGYTEEFHYMDQKMNERNFWDRNFYLLLLG